MFYPLIEQIQSYRLFIATLSSAWEDSRRFRALLLEGADENAAALPAESSFSKSLSSSSSFVSPSFPSPSPPPHRDRLDEAADCSLRGGAFNFFHTQCFLMNEITYTTAQCQQKRRDTCTCNCVTSDGNLPLVRSRGKRTTKESIGCVSSSSAHFPTLKVKLSQECITMFHRRTTY